MEIDKIPSDIATKIKACYDLLPDDETDSGAAEGSDAMIMEFRKTRLQIAADCVFAGLGINRRTGERT
jgi:hypothetical protein